MLIEGDTKYEEIKMFDYINYPFFFGIALLNFEGNPASLNIRASMEKPHKFMPVFIGSIFFVMVFTC